MTAELNRAYLVLGSNIEAATNLPAAVKALAAYGRVVAVSTVWESAPVGRADQARFLNAALRLDLSLTAHQVKLQVIDPVERRLGRRRDPADRNGPRTIDIDLVLFNDEIIAELDVPAADIGQRAFVTVPLAEVAPQVCHPGTGILLQDMARAAGTQSLLRRADVRLT